MFDGIISFVEYDELFLDKSWLWLNDPEIKELTLTPNFTKKQQQTFFDNLSEREDYKIWGVKHDGYAIGVVGLKNITEYDVEYFGYIGEKQYWDRGMFKYLFKHILEECLLLNLSTIYLHVSSNNKRAIKAYVNKGFYEVETLNEIMKLEFKL
ncbi:GCN5-related N-acetyltransferase [Shewanella pealeana ATCC 700345]|uniref:GCN5-related N-acetyltransferase n=1 Tax=Shewanella pealeana (strain ATCC 700345 / ANG-SQ1) TaxID=398579 RepID=A8H2E0_SHEPA|nr:GNAT family N-acetyltransferase [Shewanella pealeana]ABV86727.1 GCN5-related N-acetyltransferase [Shewanella pealeana ATCC 700345]